MGMPVDDDTARQERQDAVHLAWQDFVRGRPVDPASVSRPILAGWEKSRTMVRTRGALCTR